MLELHRLVVSFDRRLLNALSGAELSRSWLDKDRRVVVVNRSIVVHRRGARVGKLRSGRRGRSNLRTRDTVGAPIRSRRARVLRRIKHVWRH